MKRLLGVFVTVSYFHPSLIFAGKVGACPSGVPLRVGSLSFRFGGFQTAFIFPKFGGFDNCFCQE